MAWAKNGTPITLGSAGDDMDITDLTAKKFNVFLSHIVTSSTIGMGYTLDNTSGNDYSQRVSVNGGADSTATSQAKYQPRADSSNPDRFEIVYIINIDNEEKLMITFGMDSGASGAGTASIRWEGVGKKDTSTDTGQFTRIDINNSNTGNYLTDSNLSSIGSD